MAKVVILSDNSGIIKTADTVDHAKTKIIDENIHASAKDISFEQKVRGEYDYPITNLHGIDHSAIIRDILPFRVRISNIGITQYSSGQAAPIGIAIIGYSNLIL